MTGKFTGRRFGRYELLECLGAGGMGEVYRARDTRLDRDVAIKVIHTHKDADEASKRLEREANTLSKLNHPNIASIYDFDREGDVDFVVMELIEGETLHDRIRLGPLEEHDVLNIGMQIASGLSEAHEHGVVHRDLKPGNIMITPKGQVKLLDFGLARRVQTNVTLTATSSQTSNISGTFPYMAPEQLRNAPVGPFTDIWAFGVVLYELSTGRRPFGGDDIASIVDGVLNHTPPVPSSVRESISPGLSFIIQKALSKAPPARYQAASELGAALQALRTGSLGSGWAPPRIPLSRARKWMLPAAMMAAVIAVIAAGFWYAGRPSGGNEPPAPVTRVAVLVGGVENRTGDAAFDDLLPELLTTTLEQSRAIEVYPRSNLGLVLRRMQRDPATPLDESVGREICEREGLSAVVLQSITKLGDSFVLVARAVRPDGRLMASTRESMTSVSQLPERMDAVGKSMREAFGESAASVAQASSPLAEVTSKSLEAVQFYSRGRQRISAGDPRGAIVFLQRAIEIDPEFAMAHAALGTAYTNLLDSVRAEQHFRIAAAKADQAPEVEREKILGDFNMIRRNYDSACPHFQVLQTMRPRDFAAPLMYGLCSARRLDVATGLAETEKAHGLQPSPRTEINLALMRLLSGDAEGAAMSAEALRKSAPLLMQAGFVAGKARLALGQFESARQVYADMVAAGGDAAVEGHLGLGDLERSTGRLSEARRQFTLAHDAAAQRGNLSATTAAAVELIELSAFEGRIAEARAGLSRLKTIPPDPALAYRVGRARARAGLANEAADALQSIDALSTGPSRQYDAFKALLRAEIAMAQSRPDAALREADAALKAEGTTVAYETMARAQVAAGRTGEAIRSYEYVASHAAERCESYDPPACYGAIDAAYWVGKLKDDAGDRDGAAPFLKRFVTAWSAASAHPLAADAAKRLAGR